MKKNTLILLLVLGLLALLLPAALAESSVPKAYTEGEYIVGTDMAAGYYSFLVPPKSDALMTIVSEDGTSTRTFAPKGTAAIFRHPDEPAKATDGRYAVYLPNKAIVTLKGGTLVTIPHLRNEQSLWKYSGDGRILVGWDIADGMSGISRIDSTKPSAYSIWTKEAELGLEAVERVEITDSEMLLVQIERGWIVELENAEILVNG